MIGWIVAVLAVFFVQTLVPSTIRYLGGSGRRRKLLIALGPRDDPPPMPRAGQRAQRALRNMFEALPIFLTLSLLSLILNTAGGLASLGAAVFFFARLLYLPCYDYGVFALRSIVWAVGFAGLILMIIPILALAG